MTISETFRVYATDVIVFRGQSRKTEENHYICMKSLVAFFGDVEINELTFSHIRDWKSYLDKGRSPETVRNYIIKLRVVLAFLLVRGVIALNPDNIPVPKRTDKVPMFLTKDQVTLCIESTNRIKNKAVISLLYASGIRVSELCSLDRGQIHDNSFTVVGKGGRARLCFTDSRSMNLIEMYLKTRTDNNQALFLGSSGSRIRVSTVQETFRCLRTKVGFSVHPHTLRHSFATNLLESNTNLFHVSKMLGHAQLSTTQQYLHVIDHDLKKIYQKHHTI